jgi:hypothetical protein
MLRQTSISHAPLNKPLEKQPMHPWHGPCNRKTNVMNAAAITEESDMKIRYRKSNDTRHSTPLFVAVSKFNTDSFPVPVRHIRLGHTKVFGKFFGNKQPPTTKKDQLH